LGSQSEIYITEIYITFISIIKVVT